MTRLEPIYFGGGLPDPSHVPPIADLLSSVVNDEPDVFGYGGSDREWGYRPLRQAIAARLSARSGTELTADNVVLGNGAAGALELLASRLVRPGTVVAVEELTYPAAVRIFRDRGAVIVPLPLDEDGVQVDALERLLAEDPGSRPEVVYVIATAQSPTGTTLTPDRRKQLATLAERSGVVVIQDDTYGEICFGTPPKPMIGIARHNVVHLGSFSKVLAPGLRLGWFAAPENVCAEVVAGRFDLGTTPIVQRAVSEFIATGRYEPHLASVTALYREKRDALVAALEQSCASALVWRVPDAGLFLWATLTTADLSDVARCGTDEGVSFLGAPYFAVRATDRNGMRLAFGELPAARLTDGAKRLARAIERASRPVDHAQQG